MSLFILTKQIQMDEIDLFAEDNVPVDKPQISEQEVLEFRMTMQEDAIKHALQNNQNSLTLSIYSVVSNDIGKNLKRYFFLLVAILKDQLTELKLKFSKVTQIPEPIFNFSNLIKLQLPYYPLPRLSASLGKLTQLEELCTFLQFPLSHSLKHFGTVKLPAFREKLDNYVN